MLGTLTSSHLESSLTFRCPSIPFYLKALFLMSVSSAAQVVLREEFSGQSVPNAISSDTALEPVVVANPIPDQFVQIGEEYTYGLGRVFSGDYLRLQSTNLPDWLHLEYNQFGSYQTNMIDALGVAVSGNTVFVANWKSGLLILNVSDPSNPQYLSTYGAGNDYSVGVAVSGNTVFVANWKSGILILNVSDPSNPQNLSTYPVANSSAYGFAVSGNTLFVATGYAGVLILNVSDPSNPQYLSTYSTGRGVANGVAVSGNTVFVANGNALLILNVSDPSNPQYLSSYPAGSGSTRGVAVSGNTVFVANGNALLILNVSAPLNPRNLSTYPAGKSIINGVAVSGNTVFVANNDVGLLILDASDPSNPQLLGIYPAGGGLANGIAVSGNTVFIANGNAGLQIPDFHLAMLTGIPLNVRSGQQWEIGIIAEACNGSLIRDTFQLTADRSLPQLVKNTLIDQSILPGESLLLFFESKQLFSASDMSFLDFSLYSMNHRFLPEWLALETSPKLLSRAGRGSVHGVGISGNTVFVGNNEGLLILNVSDPFNPQNLSTYPLGNTSALGVAVLGSTVFVATWNALLILNVSDPSNPQNLSTYPAGNGYALGVAVSGNTVFVANWNALLILNVSDPSNPQNLSTYPAGNGYARGVAVSGNTVFVANDAGLLILNVSDPSNPQYLSTYQAGNAYAYGIAVSGNTVFVTNAVGLLIINVSDLSNPQNLSTYIPGPYPVFGVAVSGNTVFVANGNAGLLILNVLDPANPQLQGTYSAAGRGAVYTVAISGSTAFVANLDTGLDILGISNRYLLKIKATPSQADVGNYHLVLKATDEVGASASIPFTIRVEGPPRVNSNITWQYAQVGEVFTFNIPSDTFFAPNYDPLVFSLNATHQAALPTWLSFNKISVVLQGNRPDLKDIGTYPLHLTATDPRGGTAYINFNLTVVNAPQEIPRQPFLLVQNRHFHRSIPLDAIFDGAGQPLRYNLSFPEQGKAGLSWLKHSFVDSNLDLWGTPENITGSFTLIVTVSTSLGYHDNSPIILSINPNYPPQVKEPIPSQSVDVGGRLDFPLPSTTFEDLNGDPLSYSILADGVNLPNWLRFSKEKESWHLIAEPGGWDTNAFSSRAVMIQITARDTDNATVTTSFNLNVGGTSTIALLLRIATPILSALALFQKRAALLNRLCYNRYQKDPHTLEVGQRFSITLSTPANVVSSIEVKTRHLPSTGCGRFTDCQRFFKPPINYLQLPFDALPEGTPLPDWMKYRKVKNAIEGILPARTGYHELVVIVKNNAGVVKEQFALKLEKGAVVRQDRPPQERKRVERRVEVLELSVDADPELGGYVRLN